MSVEDIIRGPTIPTDTDAIHRDENLDQIPLDLPIVITRASLRVENIVLGKWILKGAASIGTAALLTILILGATGVIVIGGSIMPSWALLGCVIGGAMLGGTMLTEGYIWKLSQMEKKAIADQGVSVEESVLIRTNWQNAQVAAATFPYAAPVAIYNIVKLLLRRQQYEVIE